MAEKKYGESFVSDEFRPAVQASAPGTVLKSFNGQTRRYPVDYVVTEADAADLPIGMSELKDGGFIA